jgi:hypothetical protein
MIPLDPGALAPRDLWRSWYLAPGVLAALALAAGFYTAGRVRLWRAVVPRRRVGRGALVGTAAVLVMWAGGTAASCHSSSTAGGTTGSADAADASTKPKLIHPLQTGGAHASDGLLGGPGFPGTPPEDRETESEHGRSPGHAGLGWAPFGRSEDRPSVDGPQGGGGGWWGGGSHHALRSPAPARPRKHPGG